MTGIKDPEIEDATQHFDNDADLSIFVRWKKETQEDIDSVNRRLDNTNKLATSVMNLVG